MSWFQGNPFALSLSKGLLFPSPGADEGEGFDKLSPNGFGGSFLHSRAVSA
jgi:hypothetical protein